MYTFLSVSCEGHDSHSVYGNNLIVLFITQVLHHNNYVLTKIHTHSSPRPSSIFLVSRSSDSLTLQIQLSDIGTAPLLLVMMNVTLGSQLINTMEWSGKFTQGEVLEPVLVSSLQPDTNYSFQTVAVNSLGPGSLSIEFIFAAGMKL